MKAFGFFICLGLLALGLASLAAAWGSDQAGTSASSWLLQPASSRLVAMGGAGVADASGVQAWWANPASLAGFPDLNAEVSFQQHWTGAQMEFLSLAYPLSGWGVPGLGLTYIQSAPISGYNDAGAGTGDFRVQNLAAKFGWALPWQEFIFGAAATYVQEDYAVAAGRGIGFDAGAIWKLRPDLDLGAALLRCGSAGNGVPLPAEFRLGGHWRARDDFWLGLDLASPRDAVPYGAAGLEWQPHRLVSLRLGWRSGPASIRDLGALAGLTAGVGLHWSRFSLDYAFEPDAVLGTSHRFSLAYRFQPESAGEETASPEIRLKDVPEPAPRLSLEPWEADTQITITPKQPPEDLKVRSLDFQVCDAQGKIIRTFSYAGAAAIPKELVWDGKDQQGKRVDSGQAYSFSFKYVTDQGVKTEQQTWPRPGMASKLLLPGNEGDPAPQVLFQFEGGGHFRSWRVTVQDRESRRPVRVLTGTGPLPRSLEWDGKDEAGRVAPANRTYAYCLEWTSEESSQAKLERDIMPVPAEPFGHEPGRIKVKLLQFLFDFRGTGIRPDIIKRLEQALDICRRGHWTISAIQGYADEIGTPENNLKISFIRAETVRDFLKSRGAAFSANPTIQGFGEQHPVSAGQNAREREQNRRVEIVLERPAR